MRVIKRGKHNPNNWKKEYTCTGKGWDQHGATPCGALLEVSAQDIRSRSHTDLSGCTDIYYGFICPICGCFTEVNSAELPPEVKTNARKY